MTTTPNTEPADAVVIDVDGTEVEPAEHVATTAALVPVNAQDGLLIRPVASLEQTVEAFRAYQELRAELLDPSDFQEAERGKYFVTKSGWRKMSTAMSVSDELVKWEDVEDAHGRVRRSKVTVRAIAPNGRYGEGIGICDYRERCCPKVFGEPCSKGGRHRHCPDDCTGFSHFSKPQHDIPSTAHTRAKNRALSDLFGFGEVSAEEISGGSNDNTGGRDTSHDSEPASGDDVAALVAAMDAIADKGQRRGTKIGFVSKFGQPNQLTKVQVEPARRFVTAAGGVIPDPDAATKTATPHSGDGSEGGGAGERVGADPGDPPPPEPTGEPNAPATGSPAKESDRTEAAPPPEPTSREMAPSAPTPQSKPANSRQKQRIAMMCNELAALDPPLLLQGDKAELVAILTGERATSTIEMWEEEATKLISTLAFVKSGDLRVIDDPDKPGARTIEAVTPRGSGFLAPVAAAFENSPEPPVRQPGDSQVY